MYAFYAELISIRKMLAPMRPPTPQDLQVFFRAEDRLVEFESHTGAGACRVTLNFDERVHRLEGLDAAWNKLLDSSDPRWSQGDQREIPAGPAFEVQPLSCCVFATV
jgi:hypothetical protein